MSKRVVPQNTNQPQTHTIPFSILSFLPCCDDLCDLSYTQIKTYYQLRNEINIRFDINQPQHLSLLSALYQQFFNKKMLNYIDQSWLQIGFQSKNPCTDFRAGGLQSLRNIKEFLSKNQQLCRQVCKQGQFYFAASSINVTFWLIKFFHLSDGYTSIQERTNRVGLKNFLKFQSADDSIFRLIYLKMFNKLIGKWKKQKQMNPQISIMDFGKYFKIIQQQIKNIMQHTLYQSKYDFLTILQK